METKQVKVYGRESVTTPLKELTSNRRLVQAHDVEM